mmetsp:Transcript_164/g.415  ORF Transcript_164/g.415 Transcript_164/m.415 type:complete len:252 (+) Transcript_164:72-827(+)|eukprot:CAMPEP_0171352012 /NCGR_PEP_ID=MMETSP0878-20121228/40394_1 /TAXON_ID=67004 /ORGANISM="Thalassiosira weissflogii, Strain CCMP1336" /LENGTH=251 /DNA_ID=CAMNT_0011857467 /DNA_START=6 /DNA_END=761 /DNA_ORIENTATION=+
MMFSKKHLASILLVAASASNSSAFAPPLQHSTLRSSLSSLSATSPINNDHEEIHSLAQSAKSLTLTLLTTSFLLLSPLPSHADGQTKDFKLPPIDYSDKSRCTLSSSKMGQANAARDKLYDLRECDLRNAKAAEYDLSGVIMTKTDVSGANFKEAQFSKGYLRDSNFEGADFTNAIVDRATFKGSSLKGAIFQNAVLTATSFEGADVEGADFTDAYIGDFDIRNLCRNPTLMGENPKTGADTRLSANCGPK